MPALKKPNKAGLLVDAVDVYGGSNFTRKEQIKNAENWAVHLVSDPEIPARVRLYAAVEMSTLASSDTMKDAGLAAFNELSTQKDISPARRLHAALRLYRRTFDISNKRLEGYDDVRKAARRHIKELAPAAGFTPTEAFKRPLSPREELRELGRIVARPLPTLPNFSVYQFLTRAKSALMPQQSSALR